MPLKRVSLMLLAVLVALSLTGCLGGLTGGTAPVKYTVSGRIVTADTKDGLEDVTLTFTDQTDVVATDKDGNWRRPGLSGTVTVTPTKDGWAFDPETRQVTVASDNVDFTATPVSVEHILTTYSQGQGTIIKKPEQSAYARGATVELTAMANNNWVFSHWVGDLTGAENPTTLVLDGDKTVTAVFQIPGRLLIASEPQGATVYINGEKRGLTPSLIALPEGDHELTLSLFQYEDHTETVTVMSGYDELLQAELSPVDAYFPMAVGNVWTFEGETVEGSTIIEARTVTVEITGTEVVDGVTAFKQEAWVNGEVWPVTELLGGEGNAYYSYGLRDPDRDIEYYGRDLMFTAPIESGTIPWMGYEVEAVLEGISVPAGDFTAWKLTHPETANGHIVWFVPYVGIVAQKSFSWDRTLEEMMVLVDYTLN